MKISMVFNDFAGGMKNIFIGSEQEWITEVLIYGKKYRIFHFPLLELWSRRRALRAAGSEENLRKYINATKEKKLKQLFISVQHQYPVNPVNADTPKLRQMRTSLAKLPEKDEIHHKIQNTLEAAQNIDSSTKTAKQVREWLYYNELLTADENEITSEILEEVRGINSFIKRATGGLNLGLARYLLSIQEKKFNDFKKILEEDHSHPEILRHIKKTQALIDDREKETKIKH